MLSGGAADGLCMSLASWTGGALRLFVCLLMLASAASAAGVPGAIGGPGVAQAQSVGDRDGDGAPDESDACPDTPGGHNGCPAPADSDGDGIVDANDACPNTVGSAANGCPAPADTDRDGVPDASDACPTEAGPPDFNGCPSAPDADRDGTPDSTDPCPTTAGRENGCPPPAADVDSDGVPDNKDRCIAAGFAGRVRSDGCPPLWVRFRLNPSTPKGLADFRTGNMQAVCEWNGGKACVMRVKLTLSAKSARAAGLNQRVLMDRTIRLTTEAEKRFAGGYQPRGGLPVPSKLTLDLSSEQKRKLRKLPSVTLTTTMSYVFESETVQAGSKTATLKKRPPKSESEAKERSLDVQNREEPQRGPDRDAEEG